MVKTADGAAGPAEKSRVAVINACVDPGTSDAMVEKAVKAILGTPDMPGTQTTFQWHIDNKYYTADLEILIVRAGTNPKDADLDSVDAVLVLATGLDKPAVLKAIEDAWLPSLDEAAPAVRLLAELGAFAAAGSAPSPADGGTGGPAHAAAPTEATMKWAVANDFEYVDPAPEDADSSPKSYGLGRIQDALQAHMWPNLVMKPLDLPQGDADADADAADDDAEAEEASPAQDGPSIRDSGGSEAEAAEPSEAAVPTHDGGAGGVPCVDNFSIDALLQSMDVLGNEDPDNPNDGDADMFETMLVQMQALKAQAATLPDEQRKAFAEAVALKFMAAMGDDDGDGE